VSAGAFLSGDEPFRTADSTCSANICRASDTRNRAPGSSIPLIRRADWRLLPANQLYRHTIPRIWYIVEALEHHFPSGQRLGAECGWNVENLYWKAEAQAPNMNRQDWKARQNSLRGPATHGLRYTC
jgi:hypothetical protein